MTKATLLALVIFMILLGNMKFVLAAVFLLGWSLGGDGKVFTSAKAMVAEWRSKRAKA